MSRAHLLPFVGAGILASSLLAFPWAGCKPSGVGDPCIPEQEYSNSFGGFTADEVSTESESFQCETRLCFVNHFQGRVSCPYGQTDAGAGPNGGDPCVIPRSVPPGSGAGAPDSDKIKPNDKVNGQYIPPQCTDRRDKDTVFCSCRCKNIDGKTDDGSTYCSCPTGFACSAYVSSIGRNTGDQQLTGYYCEKDPSVVPEFVANASCKPENWCDPKVAAGKPGYCGQDYQIP